MARSPSNPEGEPIAHSKVVPIKFYETSGGVRIIFDSPLASTPSMLDVFLSQKTLQRVTWKPRDPSPEDTGLFGVSRRDQAAMYFFGSLAAGRNSKPSYNLDVEMASPSVHRELWRVSLRGKAKTSDSLNYDPDSFDVAARMERVYPFKPKGKAPYTDMGWDILKWEFSRKDQSYNLITAPTLTLTSTLGRRISNFRTVAALDLDANLGIEAGRNLRNEVAPEGYGGIFRVVVGGGLYAAFPRALGLAEIRWTSTYIARLLATSEPVIDTREGYRSALTRGTRHDLDSALKLKFNEFVALSIKHEYGSAPPAFKILDHRVTVGVEIMWAWHRE